jgi:hypothetical protein
MAPSTLPKTTSFPAGTGEEKTWPPVVNDQRTVPVARS